MGIKWFSLAHSRWLYIGVTCEDKTHLYVWDVTSDDFHTEHRDLTGQCLNMTLTSTGSTLVVNCAGGYYGDQLMKGESFLSFTLLIIL